VTKPFSIEELLARIRAATRRASSVEAAAAITVGDTEIDLAARPRSGRTAARAT